MITDEQIKEFLKRLAALSEETGITISGCGCCGSPTLSEAIPEDFRPIAYSVDQGHDTLRTKQASCGNEGLDALNEKYWKGACVRSTD